MNPQPGDPLHVDVPLEEVRGPGLAVATTRATAVAPTPDPAVVVAPSDAHDPDSELPKSIGKYKVIKKLGEGATSEVFLCRDEFNNRDVAIKRVRHMATVDPLSSKFNSKFYAAEASLVGRLKHPNIVQIYDAVEDPVAPYLVMEYVNGRTLRPYCRADQLLPLDLVIELGFKCAMALGYVYRQGLIHRDVKPANLLVTLDGENITDVKITDFGSVLNLGSEITQVHRVGSLAYMSPEQLDGATLDARADMYSLGVVLYQLIAGRPPFDAVVQGALMHQIYQATPPPLTQFRSDLAPEVDHVIQRALAKRPDDRWDSWEGFAKALSSLVSNQLVPRGDLQDVKDSERFSLLRSLDFFESFGDVEIWEVVRRGRWRRYKPGHHLYRCGQATSRVFHIITEGNVDIFRDAVKVAAVGVGTTVGEMAYLAPNPDLFEHKADVVITRPTTTLSFDPLSLKQLSGECQHCFDQAFIRVLVNRLNRAQEALVQSQLKAR